MRWIARLVLLLMLLAGLGLGILDPWLLRDAAGREVGIWNVYTAEGGFEPFDVTFEPADAPVRVLVEMTIAGRFQPKKDVAALTLTAAGDGRTVLAATLDFTASPPVQDSPQAPRAIYREVAGVIDPVDAGSYRVTVGPGEMDGLDIVSVEVAMHVGTSAVDERLPPIGYGLIVIGFVGLVLSFRGRAENPNSSPPPRKWGR